MLALPPSREAMGGMAEAAAPSRAAPDAGSPVSEEEVFDALLAVSLTDDTPAALVSASAQGALARLGHPVVRLVRMRMGPLRMHRLPMGEAQEVVGDDLRALLALRDAATSGAPTE